jgi:hypothetical protein
LPCSIWTNAVAKQDKIAWLRHDFADGGYAGPKLTEALAELGTCTLEIVKRPDTRCGLGGEALFLIQSKDPEHP